jgi:creatinine amidohydrolase
MNKGKNKYEKNVLQLEELSWKNIENLNIDKTIVFIPISPLEEHGPHLPVGTDYLTARDIAKKSSEILAKKKPNYFFLIFPAIPLGYSKMADCFPGTISTRVKAIRSIIFDVCSSLAQYGFKNYVICTFHMDIGHLKGIYSGIDRLKRKYDIQIIEPMGPYFFNDEVEKNEPKMGFDTKKEKHGGFRETSLMKYQYPYLVDASYIKLQSIYRDLYSPKYVGKTFKDIGINNGYVGSPAKADSDYGRWYFQDVVNTYVNSVIELIEKGNLPVLPQKIKMIMKSMFWL